MKYVNEKLEKGIIKSIFFVDDIKSRTKYLLRLESRDFQSGLGNRIYNALREDVGVAWESLGKIVGSSSAEVMDWTMLSELNGDLDRAIDDLKKLTRQRTMYAIGKALVGQGDIDVEKSMVKMGIAMSEVMKSSNKQSGSMVEARQAFLKDSRAEKIIKFPWVGVQKMTGGIRGGQVHIAGGGSGSGKSFFVQNIAMKAMMDGFKVLFFSMELKQSVNFHRMAEVLGGMGYDFGGEDPVNVLESSTSLYIYDRMTSIEDIELEVQRQNMISPVNLVIIDHLQDMEMSKGLNQYENINNVCRRSLDLAISMDIAFILVSQLNRGSSSGADRFLGSGKIEQVAHIAFILDSIRDATGKETGERNIKIVKNRGIVGMKTWTGEILTKFQGGMVLKELSKRDNNEMDF